MLAPAVGSAAAAAAAGGAATVSTVGQSWQPINTPNFNPSPGDIFKLCMAACKAMLEKIKCPSLLASTPCAVICTFVAFGGGEN